MFVLKRNVFNDQLINASLMVICLLDSWSFGLWDQRDKRLFHMVLENYEKWLLWFEPRMNPGTLGLRCIQINSNQNGLSSKWSTNWIRVTFYCRNYDRHHVGIDLFIGFSSRRKLSAAFSTKRKIFNFSVLNSRLHLTQMPWLKL